MSSKRRGFKAGLGPRLLVATAAAALLAGCSDATRFSSTDPFSNPFGGSRVASSRIDATPTGTIADHSRPAQSARIDSQPLPPPTGAPSPAPLPAPSRPAPVASRMSPGSIDHWSAQGGTPIVVAQGETAAALASRYGVPAEALLRTNGFSSASQIAPGARIVIPVYRTTAAAPARVEPRPASAPKEARAAEPVAHRDGHKETYRLVKGPEPARMGASAPARSESARAKSAEDRKRKEAEARGEKEKLAREKLAKEKASKDKARREQAAKERADKHRASAEPAQTNSERPKADQNVAKLEQPKAEPRKVEVDRETTASLPPQKAATASDEASPEFRWPARGRIIQGFKAGGNDGINISVPEGTAVKAAEGGVVKYAGSELKGYGNLVLIQHPNGFVTAYANNSELEVKRGDTVRRGQTIAKAGQTGNVSSPQVHFELRKGAKPVDPTKFLSGL